MPTAIQTLFSAWGDPSGEGRAAKINAVPANTFLYADPKTPEPITARDAFSDYVSMSGKMIPGASAKIVGLSETGTHQRVNVAFERGGAVMIMGRYFAELSSDRICKLIGFEGMGEPA